MREERTIGRYVVQSIIGEGSMGSVFKATDPHIERTVAIKSIKLDQGAQDPGFMERFKMEAQIGGNLNHPNIVGVFDVGEQDNSPYIAMEYVQGYTISSYVREKQLSSQEIVHLLNQVASGLDFAHSQDVVHRDIKPANIMVTSEGIPKIMDFGIAKKKDSKLTQTGYFLGTPSYSSPEQVKEGYVDHRSDIFSLGIVAYELLTDQLPFPGKSINAILYNIANEAPKLTEDLAPEIQEIFAKVLTKDPDSRYQTCKVFVDDLIRANWQGFAPKREAPPTPPQGHDATGAASPPRSFGAESTHHNQTLNSMAGKDAPTGFFSQSLFSKTVFFSNDVERVGEIKKSIEFYRDHLSEEYQSLLKQAKLTYHLWILCVLVGVLIFMIGLIAVFMGYTTEGIITSISTSFLLYIQKIFRQREEFYLDLASKKNKHLEYGNQWLLIIQSIDAVEDQESRRKMHVKLIKALTNKLDGAPKLATSSEGEKKA